MLVKFNKLNLTTLVDSGAARSMIRLSALHKLIRAGVTTGKLKQGVKLRSISGHAIPTLGVVEIKLFNIKCQFYVVEVLAHELLIGTDVMINCSAQINYTDKTVILAGKSHLWADVCFLNDNISGIQLEVNYWRALLPTLFPNENDKLKSTNLVSMVINTGNAHPINQRPYRIPLAKRVLVEKELRGMLNNDIIEPSHSPWASPITIVPKKDGSFRLCGDYRKLNNATIKDAYPLPRIQDIFDQLAGAKVFTTLDLKSGYWQVMIEEGSREKTAINTHMGLFQFKRMQFGLTNAPAVFQRMMNIMFANLIGKCCLVYLDDIIIYSPDEKAHLRDVKEVLEILKINNMTLKEKKCEFSLKEVKLLGFMVSSKGLSPDPDKVAAIRDMAAPTNRKEIKRLLGSTNYYRQLMPNYAEVVAPMTALTSPKVKFVWSLACQKAWEEVKLLILNCVLLKSPSSLSPWYSSDNITSLA